MSLVNKHIGCGLAVCLSALLLLQGCADDDMVQLDMQEPETLSSYDYLKGYDVLKSYSDHIGVIMDGDALTSGSGMEYRIGISNFAEVVPGNVFSNSSAVKATGAVDTASIVSVRKVAEGAGFKLLGTPLIWDQQQNSAYLESQLEPNVIRPDGDDGGYCIKFINTAIGSSANDEQVAYTFARTPQVAAGIQYSIKFWIRGTAEGTIGLRAYATSGSAAFSPDIKVTRSWTQVQSLVTIPSGVNGLASILFCVGQYVGTVYIDNIELKRWNSRTNRESGRNLNTVNTDLDDAETTANSISIQTDNNGSLENVGCSELGEGYDEQATYVEKTDEEKATILTSEMQKYLSGVMEAAKSVTADWIVVKDPLAVKDSTSTGFFWQEYLGAQTYAVTAFKEAAQHATGNLYIEQSGLDTDLSKCARFVSYVSAIESQGARVDGVAVSIDANTTSTSIDNISQMFQRLASTGKLVRITDLNVTIADATTDNVTEEQLKAQAAMYTSILQAYKDNVPEAQRGGITIHQELDGGTPNGLWSTDYSRKHAYGSVAAALQ